MTQQLTFEALRQEFLNYLLPGHLAGESSRQAEQERADRRFRIVEILKDFGAKSLSGLHPDQYAAALAQLRQLEFAACAM